MQVRGHQGPGGRACSVHRVVLNAPIIGAPAPYCHALTGSAELGARVVERDERNSDGRRGRGGTE